MTKKAAFSLVELSIVLVILGLLTGGILTGQNLIRAAELRAVTTEFSAYQTAVMTFRDKYFAIPGDMNNATRFWGAMTNCGVASPSGTGTQTCNGDGNGQIESASAASRTGEMFGFWQHLSNAGLIEGQYSGIAGSGGQFHSVINVNVPRSRLSESGWNIGEINEVTASDTLYFPGSYDSPFWMGRSMTNATTHNANLSPEEAWNIDTKIDDGKPETGKVRSRKSQAGTSTTHCSNTTTREYALQNTGLLCSLVFPKPF